MKPKISSIIFATLALMFVSVSNAQVSVNIGIGSSCGNPFSPPCPYYDAPAAVYVGGGDWGGRRGGWEHRGDWRGHDRGHGARGGEGRGGGHAGGGQLRKER